MYSLNNIRKTMGVHIELIVFMLIVAFIIYTRPTMFITFSNTLLGKLLMLTVLVASSIYNKAYGILIAVLIIAFAKHSIEGFDSNSMVKTDISTFVSWNDANTLASVNGGRLPTKDEFQSAAINVGNMDMWMPASNGTDVNFWVHVGEGYWPLYSTQPGVVNYPPPWGLTNSPAGYRPGPTGSSPINYIYIFKDTPPTGASSACPKGFAGPNASGHCTKSWSADCDESCAKDLCSKAGIKWIPLDYATNPYTCDVSKPPSMCSMASPMKDDGFANFTYEYIEQPTNQNTDVVATNPKAQYLKIKTQTNVYGPGGSAQFRVHTPAYVPSQGDTVQITINEYTGNYGSTGGPIAMINAGKWFNKDGEIPVLIYNTGGGSMNGQLTLSLLILKGEAV